MEVMYGGVQLIFTMMQDTYCCMMQAAQAALLQGKHAGAQSRLSGKQQGRQLYILLTSGKETVSQQNPLKCHLQFWLLNITRLDAKVAAAALPALRSAQNRDKQQKASAQHASSACTSCVVCQLSVQYFVPLAFGAPAC